MKREVVKSGITPIAKTNGVAGSNPAIASNLYEKLRKANRPWASVAEVPEFALIKHRGCAYDPRYPMALCIGIRENVIGGIRHHFKTRFGIEINCTWGVYPSATPDNNFWHMVHSIDGGKTWHPCGVKL